MNRTCERPPRGASQSGRSEDKKNAATQAPIATVLAGDSTAQPAQTASTDDWARAEIARATGPIPGYGTAAFEQLPDGPTKLAAAVIAAQRWRHRRVVETATGRRAREIAEARRPRPGDHRGGPVEWERSA